MNSCNQPQSLSGSCRVRDKLNQPAATSPFPGWWLVATLVCLAPPAHAEQHALLIGVSNYADERIPDLDGPRHDVGSLSELLINQWGFDSQRVTTLVDEAATEDGILGALNAIRLNSSPGDDVLIYFSGHGTSARDPDLGARLHLPDGSGALATHDLNPEALTQLAATQSVQDGLLVGRHELKPLFTRLNLERRVLVIFDTCFSGNTARAAQSDYEPANKRHLSLDIFAQSALAKSRSVTSDQQTRAGSEFAYRNLVYFGAAAEDQLAIDYSQSEIDAGLVTTFDGKPHGGFTDALLHALGSAAGKHDTLSPGQLFTLLQQQFSLRCTTCGHDPVSLPIFDRDQNGLLTKAFLQSSSTAGTVQQAQSPKDDTPPASVLTAALSSTRTLPAALTRVFPPGLQGSPPDLLINADDLSLQVLTAAGRLITTFPAAVKPERLKRWLDSRAWLKRRSRLDQKQTANQLHTQFRHPLRGNRVYAGESLYFTVQAEAAIRLGMLIMSSTGELSVLYPTTESEFNTVLPAHSPVRIPARHEPQLLVTEPWGSDTVLFYALPAKSEITDLLYSLAREPSIALTDPRLQAFEQALDSGKVPYSASTTTIMSTQ